MVCNIRNFVSLARTAATVKQIIGVAGITPELYKNLNITGTAEYATHKKRPGVLALKKGMMTLYDEHGTAHPVTCLHVDKCQALNTINVNTVGSESHRLKLVLKYRKLSMKVLNMGIGRKSPRQLSAKIIENFNNLGVAPKRHVRGFHVEDDCNIPAGHYFRALHFVPGQLVDVQAKSYAIMVVIIG